MNYYNRLTPSELSQLKDDFVNFLVLNGITGDDWAKMQSNAPAEADGMIDQFSEVVYEASLRKASFLLIVTKHDVRSFQCLSDKIIMASMKYEGSETFDFNEVDDLHALLLEGKIQFAIASVSKAYSKKREHEMYDMIKSGCKISDGKVYKLISMYWAELKSSQN